MPLWQYLAVAEIGKKQKATFDAHGLRLPSPTLMNVYILAQAQGQTGYPSPEQR